MTRLLMVFVIFLFGACDDTSTRTQQERASPALEQPDPAKTVALVMKTLTNPFFVEMERGALRAQQQFGINLIVKTAAQETSIEQQIAIIEDLTRQRVDAIVVAPGDSVKLIPSLKAARDQGIVVVNIDNRLDPRFSEQTGLAGVPFISVDNEEGAYLAARHLISGLEAPTKAAIIEGIRSAANAEARKNGALRAFRESPMVTDVVLETAHWKIDEAYDVAGVLMTQHPDIGIIFAANDMMAIGVARLLDERNLGSVGVAGFDALDEAKMAIVAGDLVATVDQQAGEQGYLGVRFALDLLEGRTTPAETYVDVKLVTRADL